MCIKSLTNITRFGRLSPLTLPIIVPSALQGFTSEFEMGSSVSPAKKTQT